MKRLPISAGVALVALLLVFITVFFSCEKGKSDPVLIGSILMLTGDSAAYGVAIRDGIELAVEKVNNGGGIHGRPLRVIFEDDRANPREGVAAIQKLINVDHVPAIIGAVASGVTLAVAPIAERSQVVLLSPASSAPAISTAGDYIFRNYPSDNLEGEVVAELAITQNCRTAAVLTINNEYGDGLNKVFTRAYTNRGGNIILNDSFLEGSRDFRTILTRVATGAPECIFVVGYAKELGTLIRQARGLGITSQFYSTVNFYDEETLRVGGKELEGTVFSSPVFDPESREPNTSEFVSLFSKRFGKKPDVWAAHGYDAVLLLAEAMRKHGSQPDDIKKGLYEIKAFPGVAGETTFDGNGDVKKPVRFLTVHDLEFVPYTH